MEKHELNKINIIYWRNSQLNFESLNGLVNTLETKSNNEFLKKINDCEDEKVLKLLIKNKKDLKISETRDIIKTLWECCQIPDFSKKAYGRHI